MTRNQTRSHALIGAVAAVLLSQSALPQTTQAPSLYGSPIPADGPVNKVIRVDANTRSVNVNQDDTVRFVVSGPGGEKTFAWHFVTSALAVDLGTIAPAGLIERKLFAYLAPNPYRCGGG